MNIVNNTSFKSRHQTNSSESSNIFNGRRSLVCRLTVEHLTAPVLKSTSASILKEKKLDAKWALVVAVQETQKLRLF